MASLLKKPLILYDLRTDKPVKRKWQGRCCGGHVNCTNDDLLDDPR